MWHALLQAFGSFYRNETDCGSAAIAAHAARVNALLDEVLLRPLQFRQRVPAAKPVVRYLEVALQQAEHGALADTAMAIRHAAGQLTWEYGYASVPPPLDQNYAYCELMGPQGPVLSERLIFGLVLFAPGTVYPQHSHKGIEESYVSISGRWSQNGAAIHVPGSLVFNPPETEHMITTGCAGPCLLGYAWMGDEARLSAPGMVFS